MTLRAGVLIVAAVASIASAQNSATIRSRSSLSVVSSANMEHIPHTNSLSAGDIRFLREMSIVNRAEVKLGQLAQSRGGEWAKGYGKDMEREHNLALADLQKIASEAGISLPTDLDAKHKALWARLSTLNGPAFDRAYRQAMVSGHNDVLGMVQAEIHGGHSEKARDYAVMTETAVKLHLKMARESSTMMSPEADG